MFIVNEPRENLNQSARSRSSWPSSALASLSPRRATPIPATSTVIIVCTSAFHRVPVAGSHGTCPVLARHFDQLSKSPSHGIKGIHDQHKDDKASVFHDLLASSLLGRLAISLKGGAGHANDKNLDLFGNVVLFSSSLLLTLDSRLHLLVVVVFLVCCLERVCLKVKNTFPLQPANKNLFVTFDHCQDGSVSLSHGVGILFLVLFIVSLSRSSTATPSSPNIDIVAIFEKVKLGGSGHGSLPKKNEGDFTLDDIIVDIDLLLSAGDILVKGAGQNGPKNLGRLQVGKVILSDYILVVEQLNVLNLGPALGVSNVRQHGLVFPRGFLFFQNPPCQSQ